MQEIFRLEIGRQGIASIIWDLPDASMNVLNEQGIRELDAHIDTALSDDQIKGIIITSGKKDFAGGMDLNVIADIRARAVSQSEHEAETIFGFVMALHRLLRKIEQAGMDPRTQEGGKPIVWAAPGTAAGIGLEIGLACHYRIAADAPGARIGLPEALIGLFPGAGGTTRLIRMLGLMGAGEILLQGKMLNPAKAKAAGIIHEVVAPDDLLERAQAWAQAATARDIVKPWDKKGFKLPGGAPYTAQGFEMFLGGVAMTHGKTKGVYPAIRAMLSAIYEGALVPFDTALRIEARWFTKTLMTPSSAAMIRTLFINKQALEKGAKRPAEVTQDMRVKKLGILGAGMMGSGIGYVAARAGIEIVLLDRDQEAADKGKANIAGLLEAEVGKKRLSQLESDEIFHRIHAGTNYAKLKGCDLVIEAVFEDPDIKAQVTAQAEAEIGDSAVIASNTSSLPITDLAKATRRPERFIGLHFFSPVHKMQLVEIIKGRETQGEALARALDFVRQIRKTPIVVNDARFFYANRCIIPYLNEGLIMITEGVGPALIENAAKQMGMPLGPLQLTDETSLELGYKIAKATQAALGDGYHRSDADDLLAEMVEKRGRLGRKNNQGLYAYDDKGNRRGLWPGLAEIWPLAKDQPALETVQNRLMMAQALEAVRALEEGVIDDIREADVGAVMGWGFAPWSGGPLAWLDIIGAKAACEICRKLADQYGPRFQAPSLLQTFAQDKSGFYAHFRPTEAARS